MKIISKYVHNMTDTEFRACRLANYGWGGYMKDELIACWNGDDGRRGRVIMLWDGPKDRTASLKGWALLTPTRTWGEVAGSYWNKKRSIYTAQFWVKAKYRKNGYADKLMREVNKLDPCPHVFPHNKRSGAFFAKYNVTASADDKTWTTKKRLAS